MAARSVTGTSKRTITGMPMPTVCPATGAKLGKVCWSRVSASVRNDERFSDLRPSLTTTTVCTR